MILVTVGNATQSFRRLLEAVDFQAREGVLQGEDILFQYGYTSHFVPSRGRHLAFLPLEKFEASVKEAELVISHAGTGTVMHLLQSGKIPVVMPRRKKFGEHVDDHQLEFTQALEAEGRVISVYEETQWGEAIEQARRTKLDQSRLGPGEAVNVVKHAIEEFLHSQ